MAYNFPDTPTVGQQFANWTWDGEKWVLSSAMPSGAVRYDLAQSLTATQQTQGRFNIGASAFDAAAMNGIQINGGFEISQEIGFTVFGLTGYFCDGWKLERTGSMVSSAATSTWPGSAKFGFPNVGYIQIATAQPSLGAGDRLYFAQPIEGNRLARLSWGWSNALPVTIGFWSAHAKPGVYSVSFSAGQAPNRSYVCSYTHAAADVAQYNVMTIPGCQDGTWPTDNTVGLFVCFTAAAGSNFITPSPNTWQPATYLAVPGQWNGAGTNLDVLRIFGVAILPGNEALSAARSPLLMRPISEELLRCQRYWEAGITSGAPNNDAVFSSGSVADLYTSFNHKRTNPTMNFFDGAGTAQRFNNGVSLVGTNGQVVTGGSIIQGINPDGFMSDFAAMGCSTNRFSFKWVADARF